MTKRIEQINDLLREELGKILLKEVDFSKDILVTLTRVDVSPNLQQAKVYVSVLPEGKLKEIIRILDSQIYDIQQILNKRLKMRPVPRIDFVEESSTVEAERIEVILEQIKKKK